ncbi:DNA polymerase epsilon subunit 2-like [Homarus americanus]|uniref:DNA polymerase epsilon subunit 2-like n=1 Tax=Homarus americanus TaxID=6706 RepID=UPI001C49637B|nr:DNA polymerase epsilon subunit 2-like [Homarus americanus]
MSSNKSHVINLFKLHGLAVRSDGAKYLCELLDPLPKDEHDEWIEKVIDAVQKLPISSTLISKEHIHKAAQEVGTSENDDIENLLQIVDIYKVPKLMYNLERKKFVLAPTRARDLHGDASDKAALFRDRYTVVYQRTCNHDLFRQPVVGMTDDDNKKFGLTKVEFLMGSSSRLEEVVTLGLLTQLVEGQHHLEDDTGAVRLDLTNTKFHTGLFTHNCFVLVDGWYEDGLLHANAIGLPPPEAPSSTRALIGNINYFGGQGNVCAKNNPRLQQIEQENKDAMFVVLSDVWLDKIKVTEKLQTLFNGYAQFPPTAFIFCGNFVSSCHGAQQAHDLRQALGSLGTLIAGYPELMAHSRFIFVPGPNDPGPCNIYPRPTSPANITEEIKKAVPSAFFVSNPCRLLFCTQEIVIFRENIVAKMCRNCVYFPANSDDIPAHFAKTLVSQGHLAALPLHVLPVYWGLDHCLSLHPTPDVIITADKGDSFTTTHNQSIIMNPGSFAKTDFSFKVYMPATRQVEDSQIADDDT